MTEWLLRWLTPLGRGQSRAIIGNHEPSHDLYSQAEAPGAGAPEQDICRCQDSRLSSANTP